MQIKDKYKNTGHIAIRLSKAYKTILFDTTWPSIRYNQAQLIKLYKHKEMKEYLDSYTEIEIVDMQLEIEDIINNPDMYKMDELRMMFPNIKERSRIDFIEQIKLLYNNE